MLRVSSPAPTGCQPRAPRVLARIERRGSRKVLDRQSVSHAGLIMGTQVAGVFGVCSALWPSATGAVRSGWLGDSGHVSSRCQGISSYYMMNRIIHTIGSRRERSIWSGPSPAHGLPLRPSRTDDRCSCNPFASSQGRGDAFRLPRREAPRCSDRWSPPGAASPDPRDAGAGAESPPARRRGGGSTRGRAPEAGSWRQS